MEHYPVHLSTPKRIVVGVLAAMFSAFMFWGAHDVLQALMGRENIMEFDPKGART